MLLMPDLWVRVIHLWWEAVDMRMSLTLVLKSWEIVLSLRALSHKMGEMILLLRSHFSTVLEKPLKVNFDVVSFWGMFPEYFNDKKVSQVVFVPLLVK